MHITRLARYAPPWRWYYSDIALMAIPLWFGAMIDPWGVLSYLAGLINVPFTLIALMMSVTLIPVALVCFVVVLVRLLVIWPRHIRGRRLLATWGFIVVVFVTAFVLPFTLDMYNPVARYMSGFKRHVERRVDIPAVQTWLATLEPSPLQPGRAHPDIPVEESDLPASIADLNAWGWRMEFDDEERPRIRLMWGSGIMRSWGLVVGDKDMETPPSDLSRYGEYRLPVAPGAYVWREIR